MVCLRDTSICQPVEYGISLFRIFATRRFEPSVEFLAIPSYPSDAYAYQVPRISPQGILCPTIFISNIEDVKVDVYFIIHLEKTVGDEMVRDPYPDIDEIDGKIKGNSSPYAAGWKQAS